MIIALTRLALLRPRGNEGCYFCFTGPYRRPARLESTMTRRFPNVAFECRTCACALLAGHRTRAAVIAHEARRLWARGKGCDAFGAAFPAQTEGCSGASGWCSFSSPLNGGLL